MTLSYNGHNPFLEQAALWATVLEEEDTAAHRVAFGRWLKDSPKHVEAVLVLAAAVHEAHRFKTAREQLQQVVTMTTLAPAIEASNDPTPLPFRPLPRPPIRYPPRPWVRALVWVPGLCAAIFLLVLSLPLLRQKPLPALITSASIAALPDRVIDEAGFVTLGPESVMRVATHSSVRDHILPRGVGHAVTVLNGAAYFSGRHGRGSYLKVQSGRNTIEALGTEFKVQNEAGLTAIAVFNGTVKVTRCEALTDDSRGDLALPQGPSSEANTAVLRTNQMARASTEDCAGALEVRRLPAPESAPNTSPNDEWLSFHNTPVDQAAEMFNRANSHYLIVVNHAVAKVRIGGHFKTSDVDGFIRGLEALGVRAVRGTPASEGTVIYLVK